MLLKESIEEIIEAGIFINQAGLCPATSGNISMRLDENFIAVTATGAHKGKLTSDDILIVNLQGHPVNSEKKPSAETLLHTILYQYSSQINAVIHTHSVNGTVLSMLPSLQNVLITQGYEMHKAFKGIKTHQGELRIPLFENNQDMEILSKEIMQFLLKHPLIYGYLLKGHGLYTWATTMQEAKWRVEAFEFLFACELKMRSINLCK